MAGRRIEGPTIHGGAYAEMYEDDGTIEIVECDKSGDVIFRTYGITSGSERGRGGLVTLFESIEEENRA